MTNRRAIRGGRRRWALVATGLTAGAIPATASANDNDIPVGLRVEGALGGWGGDGHQGSSVDGNLLVLAGPARLGASIGYDGALLDYDGFTPALVLGTGLPLGATFSLEAQTTAGITSYASVGNDGWLSVDDPGGSTNMLTGGLRLGLLGKTTPRVLGKGRVGYSIGCWLWAETNFERRPVSYSYEKDEWNLLLPLPIPVKTGTRNVTKTVIAGTHRYGVSLSLGADFL